jgi:sugar transferase EpsL
MTSIASYSEETRLHRRRTGLALKRLTDIAAATAGLVLLSPILFATAVAVWWKMGWPVLFRQARPGMNEQSFTVLKFRTMTNQRGVDGDLLPDADRLPPLGRLLRRFSIDELPQLWNVLIGDMSLVGPRPLLNEYLGRYTPTQARRHLMRPGITGLAQINGRNSLLFGERLRYDVGYIDNWSYLLDLKIIVRTVYLVVFAKLYDGAGQDVSIVDDIGLSSETRSARSGPQARKQPETDDPPQRAGTRPTTFEGGYGMNREAAGKLLVNCGGKSVGLILQLRPAMHQVAALRSAPLVVADRAALTPGGCCADETFAVPGIAEPDYVDALLDLCRTQDVRILLPLMDLDLDRLSPHLARFADIGTTVVCPPPHLVELCLDKSRFEALAGENGLAHPTSYTLDQVDEGMLPLFAKRRRGFGSIGSGICVRMDEAVTAAERYPDMIFQEVVRAAEVSVDAYINAGGKCIVRVPRVRNKVIGGEAVQTTTVRNPELADLADRTIAVLARRGLRGALNIQMFDAACPTLIEVNTRLGSGAVLSNMATGGRLLQALLAEAMGDEQAGDPDDYRDGLALYRYPGEVFHAGTEVVATFPRLERR